MVAFEQIGNDNIMDHASNGSPCSSDLSNLDGASSPRLGHEYQAEIPSMVKKFKQLPHLMNPADAIEHEKAAIVKKNGLSDNDNELKQTTYQSVTTGDSKSSHLSKGINYVMGPDTLNNSWSDADRKSFLVGLYIFGKNFIQIKGFLENKGMGDILSFYYGKFYKTDEYLRWSKCRKVKGRKCIIGQKLLTGKRQQELLSRLIPHVSEESQDTLQQVSKSYVEGRTSLEEYMSFLKSTIGLGVLVEAIGIGKENEDLTRLVVEPVKNNRAPSTPTCKAWSSLGPSGIMEILSGGSRLSKTKCNDLFWEAVWPRLLARGWHSEQPKNRGYVTSKDYLVYLIPGVKKFSRRKLVKGDHYFDSVSDVLSRVVAEPTLIELEEEAEVGSCNDEKAEKGLNNDGESSDQRQCYLKPRASPYNKDHIKFMVIDTSLVHGRKSSDLKELKSVKSLPVNSMGKVEVDAAGIKPEGKKHMKKVKHEKHMTKSIKKKSTKFAIVDTSILSEGKLLKVRQPKYPPVGLEDASKMAGLLRESKGSSSDDDSPTVVEAKMLTYCKKKINKTDNCKGVSDSDATNKKEAYANPGNDANKMVESRQNQKTCVSNDNQQKRTIKIQFNRRVRSSDSNHAAPPVKRRRLTACVKAEKSRIIENSSGGLGSENSVFSTNKNITDLVSHQHNGSSVASSAERSVEKSNEENILNDNSQHVSVSCVKVEKFKSLPRITFKEPRVPSKSENVEMVKKVEEDGKRPKANDPCLTSDTHEGVEKPLRRPCDVLEQQPNINPRRQSTRNRPLTVRALESLAYEFLHVERRHKRKDIPTDRDTFNPCRRARTKGKTVLHRHCSDHGAAVLVQEEKNLNGDGSVS